MNFKTYDWLKKLTVPTLKTKASPAILPISKPMQQMTGQVGGMQTTAQQTQPWSALLGGWFNPQGQQNTPSDALMSWLSPQITQMIRSNMGKVNKSWTPALPQNITNTLLKRPRG